MITREIDTSLLRSKIYDLRDALIAQGRVADAGTIIEDQSRLFARQMVVTTPPYGLGTASKKKGEHAVEGDLNKIFTGVQEEMLNTIGSEHGVSDIDAWIESSGRPLHLQWKRIDPTGQGMKAFHYAQKNARGRTRKGKYRMAADAWFAPYVVSKEDLKAYMDKMMARVGRRKASWAVSWMQLGGSVQRWIRRHIEGGGVKGRCVERLTGNFPQVTMASSAAGISGDAHIVESALKIRRQAIGRQIRGILSGYSQDWKNGLRITRKTRNQPAGAL